MIAWFRSNPQEPSDVTTTVSTIKTGDWVGGAWFDSGSAPIYFRYRHQPDAGFAYRAETYDGQYWYEANTEDAATFGLVDMITRPQRTGMDDGS